MWGMEINRVCQHFAVLYCKLPPTPVIKEFGIDRIEDLDKKL
jgi:hypothetical protein